MKATSGLTELERFREESITALRAVVAKLTADNEALKARIINMEIERERLINQWQNHAPVVGA